MLVRARRRALDNSPSVGRRWQVKNSWGHGHDLPSPRPTPGPATHSHSRPGTRVTQARPTQHPLVPIHLQLVGVYNFCLSHQMGNLDTNHHTWLEHIQAIRTSAQSMYNESRKPQHRCTYIRHKCAISMRQVMDMTRIPPCHLST
jgi:hypothetical protein